MVTNRFLRVRISKNLCNILANEVRLFVNEYRSDVPKAVLSKI